MRRFPVSIAGLLLSSLLIHPIGGQAADEPPAAAKTASPWLMDFAKAKALAAQDKKDLLLEFTGSDWCPSCVELRENVLSQEDFTKGAAEKFVLVEIDMPNDKSGQTPEQIKQNEQLCNQYRVEGFPTVLLTDAQGRPYASVSGYSGGGPAEFVEQLAQMQQLRVQRDELLAKAAQAKGVEKAKLLDEVVRDLDPELAAATYRDTIQEIIGSDAANTAGLKAKYRSVLELADVSAELDKVVASHATDGLDKSVKKTEEIIARLKPQGLALQRALSLKGSLLYNLDKEAAKKVLEEAVAADPESPQGLQLRRALQMLAEQEQRAAEAQAEQQEAAAKSGTSG